MTIPSSVDVDNILDSGKDSFSAPSRPFRMTGYVFNAYGSRAIDSALICNSISRGSSTFDVAKPFLLIRRKWASVTDVSKHWSELPNCLQPSVLVLINRLSREAAKRGIDISVNSSTASAWVSPRPFAISWLESDMVLSRLRSGLSTHLCGLSLECQGAFAAKR